MSEEFWSFLRKQESRFLTAPYLRRDGVWIPASVGRIAFEL